MLTQEEIVKNWKGNIKKPLVSICTPTYNHERFIEEALKSFLMQKTSFPFEVIVRDDYSSDNTRKIIKQYAEKYPLIIKPVYEKENQYKKGIKPIPATCKYAKGKYIAICEGDDYWIDENKLSIQIKLMQKFDVNISFHPAIKLCKWNKKKITGKRSHKTCIIPFKKVLLGGGSFMPTASIIVKRECFLSLPKWVKNFVHAEDYYLQVLFSYPKGALYINKIMSVYRRDTNTCWSARKDTNAKMFLDITHKALKSLDLLDKELNYKYTREIKIRKIEYLKRLMRANHINIEDKRIFFNKYEKILPLKYKVQWHFIYRNPLLGDLIYKFK